MENSQNHQNPDFQRQSKISFRAVALFSLVFWTESESFEQTFLTKLDLEDWLCRVRRAPDDFLRIPDLGLIIILKTYKFQITVMMNDDDVGRRGCQGARPALHCAGLVLV